MLTFKSFSSAKKMRLCLLLLRFRRDEAHLGPLCGGDNRFGIHSIVLLAFTNGHTYCGAISRTLWPSFASSRDQ